MRLLESLGYSLYASLGTADFYTEHGVKVRGGLPPSPSGSKGGSTFPLPRCRPNRVCKKAKKFLEGSPALLTC